MYIYPIQVMLLELGNVTWLLYLTLLHTYTKEISVQYTQVYEFDDAYDASNDLDVSKKIQHVNFVLSSN